MRLRIATTFVFLLLVSLQLSAQKTDKEKVHAVEPAELFQVIAHADKIVVYDSRIERNTPLYTSTDAKDISELKAALTIDRPGEWFRCACIPSISIVLSGHGKALGTITVNHGEDIGFSRWEGDAHIQDMEKWLAWFDARKIGIPRAEMEQERAILEKYRVAEERWNKAMPASLRPLWNQAARSIEPPHTLDTKPLDEALAREFPNTAERIRTLMSWYGSGEGKWSGFPAYEDVAEEMLLKYSTAELVSAVQNVDLNAQEQEGAARLFAGWTFNQRRPDDNALIPSETKRLLLEHSLKSSDKDKTARARKWLAKSN